METKYRKIPLIINLLFTFMSFVFFVVACYTLTYFTTFSISLTFLFLSTTIFLIMIYGQQIIYMKIHNDKLVFKQIPGLNHHEYAFNDIIGYKVEILKNRNGESPKLLIKTSSEKVIEINGFLISNIKEIEMKIKKIVRYDNSIKEPYINFKDKLFILLTTFFIMCFICFLFSLL